MIMQMKWLAMLTLLTVMAACSPEKPVPEGNKKDSIVPTEIHESDRNAIETMNSQIRKFQVRHHVEGNNVYEECYVPDFTFNGERNTKKEGEGHIVLYIDGKKKSDIYSAAFIIKGLSKGRHTINLELVYNDSTSYQLKKEWIVNI